MPIRTVVSSAASSAMVRHQSSPRRSRSSRSMGTSGYRTSRLPARMAMVCPTRWAGVSHAPTSAVSMFRVISVVHGRCVVMVYIGPLGEASGALRNAHSRETATTGPAPGLTSVMKPATTAARSA